MLIRYVRDYYLYLSMSNDGQRHVSEKSFLRARDDLDDLLSEHKTTPYPEGPREEERADRG